MTAGIPAQLTEEDADAQAVLAHAFRGKMLNPDVLKRVHARAEKVREEMRKRGTTNFAIDLLHESRNER